MAEDEDAATPSVPLPTQSATQPQEAVSLADALCRPPGAIALPAYLLERSERGAATASGGHSPEPSHRGRSTLRAPELDARLRVAFEGRERSVLLHATRAAERWAGTTWSASLCGLGWTGEMARALEVVCLAEAEAQAAGKWTAASRGVSYRQADNPRLMQGLISAMRSLLCSPSARELGISSDAKRALAAMVSCLHYVLDDESSRCGRDLRGRSSALPCVGSAGSHRPLISTNVPCAALEALAALVQVHGSHVLDDPADGLAEAARSSIAACGPDTSAASSPSFASVLVSAAASQQGPVRRAAAAALGALLTTDAGRCFVLRHSLVDLVSQLAADAPYRDSGVRSAALSAAALLAGTREGWAALRAAHLAVCGPSCYAADVLNIMVTSAEVNEPLAAAAMGVLIRAIHGEGDGACAAVVRAASDKATATISEPPLETPVGVVQQLSLAGALRVLCSSPDADVVVRAVELTDALCKGSAQGMAGKPRPTSQEQAGPGPGATTWQLSSLLDVPAIMRAAEQNTLQCVRERTARFTGTGGMALLRQDPAPLETNERPSRHRRGQQQREPFFFGPRQRRHECD
jgi:hypothetical protein